MARHFTFALLLCAAAFTPVPMSASQSLFQDRKMTIGETAYSYKVFVPANWDKKRKWPVMLFLHGAGERGDDNVLQTRVGLGPAIERDPKSFNCIVVMPQCAKGRWWPEPDMQAVALKALEQSMSEFNGDPARVYLTGISMGGYGTWAIASSEAGAGRFAALAPVCGGVMPPPRVPVPPGLSVQSATPDPYAAVAQRVGKTPVWIFHGAADPVVPASESRKMAEALKAINGNVRYSEYEGVEHNSWDRAYAEPDFVSWVLSQRLEPGKPAANKPKKR